MPASGMDVDAVLLSVQERDKWRHRLGLLEHSLEEVRAKRARWQSRLKRLEADLRRLADYSDALLGQAVRSDGAEAMVRRTGEAFHDRALELPGGAEPGLRGDRAAGAGGALPRPAGPRCPGPGPVLRASAREAPAGLGPTGPPARDLPQARVSPAVRSMRVLVFGAGRPVASSGPISPAPGSRSTSWRVGHMSPPSERTGSSLRA